MNLEKIRVYQLARELNTNSKRLMEKLAEVGVVVKNHMSLLEDNELESLYKHIGIKVRAQDPERGDASGTPAGEPTSAGGHSAQHPADGKPVETASAASAGGAAAAGKVVSAKGAAAAGAEGQPRVEPAGATHAGVTAASVSPAGGAHAGGATSAGGAAASVSPASGVPAGGARESKAARDAKNAPRIIRTTEIDLDRAAREDRRDVLRAAAGSRQQQETARRQPGQSGQQGKPAADRQGGGRRSRRDRDRRRGGQGGADRGDHIRASESTSGLIAGFTRMTREETMKQLLIEARAQQKRNAQIAAEEEAVRAANAKKAAEEEAIRAAEAKVREAEEEAARAAEAKAREAEDAARAAEREAARAAVSRDGEKPSGVAAETAGAPAEPVRQRQPATGGQNAAGQRADGRVGQPQGQRVTGQGQSQGQRAVGMSRQDGRQPVRGDGRSSDGRYGDGRSSDGRYGEGRSQPRASFDGRPYQQQGQDGRVGGQPQAQRIAGPRQDGGFRRDARPQDGGRSQPRASFDGRPYQQQGQGTYAPRDGAPQRDGRPYTPRDGAYAPRDGRPAAYGQRDGRPAAGARDGRPAAAGGRPMGGARPRPLDRARPEAGKTGADTGPAKSELKREFSRKDAAKEVKKDMRRDSAKPAPATAANDRSRRFRPQVSIIGEKKGVHEFTDEFIINEFYDTTGDGAKRSRRQRQRKVLRKEKYIPPRAILTSVTIPENLTVKELAEALKKTAGDVIKKLIGLGMTATINEVVDFDTAALVAGEFGVAAEKEVVVNEEDILFDDAEAEDGELVTRPPVVVVMGHVDHGKTSLLDSIRKTNVIAGEAGGITQHIGAYMVNINGRAITFLDTPGHEAFTSMRARGAMVTDIAIIVISAVDGVMPQTVEAINHAKAANVSIIIAINMFDREGANNPERVKQELTEHGLVVEEWGGDTVAVEVSAKTGENVGQLLEMVLLTADVLELKASTSRQAKGTVIEAKLDRSRGPVATLLVQRGVLRVGDSFITGSTVGRIRAMLDDSGGGIREAGPSTPVEIIGLSEVPEAGEVFYVTTDDRVTKSLAEKRRQLQREEQLRASARVTLDDLFSQIQEGKVKDLNLIVKADVQGSAEAVRNSLEKITTDEVRVNIIHAGVGAINESDVTLAGVSNAIIIGFNVRPGGASVIEAAEAAGVDVRLYTVIYNAIEDIQAALKGMLDPTFREVVLGHVEIRQIFRASGVGTIGGCYVLDGKIQRGNSVRLLRNGTVVYDGKLASLRRFKDDAREVMQGFECGISIERFNDLKESDIIEPYMMEEIPVE